MFSFENDDIYKESVETLEKKLSLYKENEILLLKYVYKMLYELSLNDLLIDTLGNKKEKIDFKLVFSFMSNEDNFSYLISYCKINKVNLEFLNLKLLKNKEFNFLLFNKNEKIDLSIFDKKLNNNLNNTIHLIPIINFNTIYDIKLYKDIKIETIITDYIRKEINIQNFVILKTDFIKDALGNLIAITKISEEK